MSSTPIFVSSSDQRVRSHIKKYYSELLSGNEFSLSQLEDSYRRMAPTIHVNLFTEKIDIDVLNFCLSRLPPEIFSTQKVILAQNRQILSAAGYDLNNYVEVFAPRRRRRTFFSQDNSLLISILSSDSDLDDLINILIAAEIEFKKIQTKLNTFNSPKTPLNQALGLSLEDFDKFLLLFPKAIIWSEFIKNFTGFRVKLIDYQKSYYSQLSADWLQKLVSSSAIFDLRNIPIYFVSSNLHSLLNIIGGYVNLHQYEIYEYLRMQHPDLYQQLQDIVSDPKSFRKEDFYYYVSNLYLRDNPKMEFNKRDWEEKLGIKNIPLLHDLQCNLQIFPVSSLTTSSFIDNSLIIKDRQKLSHSQSLIINIDYPLGFTAYLILNEILSSFTKILGIYIVGKAGILAGDVGDIQIPEVVFDERLNNVISFDNVFDQNFPRTSQNFSVLHNQKAISVQGVILENQSQLDNYSKLNINIIEMESGSYLSAIAQKYYFNGQFPQNQVCKLDKLPFDLGIINYASDNPLSAHLGKGALALKGTEPAYASLLTITQRIIDLEESR